jgi:hypothetical protein
VPVGGILGESNDPPAGPGAMADGTCMHQARWEWGGAGLADGHDEGDNMTVFRHPLSGALYSLRDDGLVEVENNGLSGVFRSDGRHVDGDIRQADPHLCLWIAGPQLPDAANVRRNR